MSIRERDNSRIELDNSLIRKHMYKDRNKCIMCLIMQFSNSIALMLCVLLKKMISHLKFVLSHPHLSLFSIPHHTKTLQFQNQEGSVH